jgi:hypothetical protein
MSQEEAFPHSDLFAAACTCCYHVARPLPSRRCQPADVRCVWARSAYFGRWSAMQSGGRRPGWTAWQTSATLWCSWTSPSTPSTARCPLDRRARLCCGPARALSSLSLAAWQSTIEHEGRLTIELFSHIVPKTAENFRSFCTGQVLNPRTHKPVGYRNSIFHRIMRGFLVQGGDFVRFDGTGCYSIFGGLRSRPQPRTRSTPSAVRDGGGGAGVQLC